LGDTLAEIQLPDTTEEKEPEVVPSRIVLEFNNNTSVEFKLTTSNVSIPQLELAGAFLRRTADKLYSQQEAINMQMQKIVQAPAGMTIPRNS
jgi:hypothetical protein